MVSDPLGALVPWPSSVDVHGGAYTIAATAHLVVPVDPAAAGVGDHLVADLQGICAVVLTRGDSPTAGDIELVVRPERTDLGGEGYQLDVRTEGVRVEAAGAHGLWNGTRTLMQLVPRDGAAPTLPTLRIVDVPRYEWRGAMLDVARHFFGVDHVKRFIELLARFKLNRLHLHLSDDQGWRIEVPDWPALTSVGGSGAVADAVGGWFSLRDYDEIVAHAARHFVVVVPEIDMPGHTHAALASVAELNPDGTRPPLYAGKEVGFSSLRLDLPATERFVADVLGTLARHTPWPYLHVGGDEAHATERAEYEAFVAHVQEVVHGLGRTMVGWEEIAGVPLRPGTLVQHWLHADVAAGASDGARFVLSPASRTYLDMRHDEHDPFGRRWAGDIDLDTIYDWDPATVLPGVDPQRIAGVEAPLWTEKVRTFEQVEHLTFPRLLALAEVGWTPQSAREYDGFRSRALEQSRRLAALGVHVAER